MLEIKNQKTKTTACRENGRSADFTSGNFILGCSHKKEILMIIPALIAMCKIRQTKNCTSILTQMSCWQSATKPYKTFPRVPNQVDEKYYYVDISCDTDINLHWNDYDWIYVFDYFKKHPKLAATFATKWVNTKLLDYVPENKIRVRMSLMPEKMRAILENGTSPYKKRVQFLEKLFQAGYSTHINFSPIISTKTEQVQRTLQHH
jgi:spore photoproduct lyase